MLLSLSGFLFERDYRRQTVAMGRFCRIARAAGYDGVELRRTQVNPQMPAGERREVRRIVDGEGLAVTCLTARGLPPPGPPRDHFFQAYLELCRELDCPLMKIGADPRWLHDAAERAAPFGVTLAANNHVGGPLETVAGTRQFLAAVNHPNFGLLYDALHLRSTGQDYLGCIASLLPVVRNVLVHSVRPALTDPSSPSDGGPHVVPALPDEPGVQDWPAILRAFRAGGYDGPVTVIESGWPDGRCASVARHCAELLRCWWASAGPAG